MTGQRRSSVLNRPLAEPTAEKGRSESDIKQAEVVGGQEPDTSTRDTVSLEKSNTCSVAKEAKSALAASTANSKVTKIRRGPLGARKNLSQGTQQEEKDEARSNLKRKRGARVDGAGEADCTDKKDEEAHLKREKPQSATKAEAKALPRETAKASQKNKDQSLTSSKNGLQSKPQKVPDKSAGKLATPKPKATKSKLQKRSTGTTPQPKAKELRSEPQHTQQAVTALPWAERNTGGEHAARSTPAGQGKEKPSPEKRPPQSNSSLPTKQGPSLYTAAVRNIAAEGSSSDTEEGFEVPIALHPHNAQLAKQMLSEEEAAPVLCSVCGPSISSLRAAAKLPTPHEIAAPNDALRSQHFTPPGAPASPQVTKILSCYPEECGQVGMGSCWSSDSDPEGAVEVGIEVIPSIAIYSLSSEGEAFNVKKPAPCEQPSAQRRRQRAAAQAPVGCSTPRTKTVPVSPDNREECHPSYERPVPSSQESTRGSSEFMASQMHPQQPSTHLPSLEFLGNITKDLDLLLTHSLLNENDGRQGLANQVMGRSEEEAMMELRGLEASLQILSGKQDINQLALTLQYLAHLRVPAELLQQTRIADCVSPLQNARPIS